MRLGGDVAARLWLIELKVEHRSHVPVQLPWCVALARHDYPNGCNQIAKKALDAKTTENSPARCRGG